MPKKDASWGPREWSPRNPDPPEKIFHELKRIAPSIVFSVSRTEDEDSKWDGDGPDPAEEGFVAYNVEVTAMAIVKGEEIEGVTYLGGSYDKPGEQDPDIHGYLPQMLDDALDDMVGTLSGLLLRQAKAAKKYLRDAMKRRYDAHMRERS